MIISQPSTFSIKSIWHSCWCLSPLQETLPILVFWVAHSPGFPPPLWLILFNLFCEFHFFSVPSKWMLECSRVHYLDLFSFLSMSEWSHSADSLRPHGLQSSRLLHPWGESTGVGCHFLQGIFPTQGLNLGLPHCRQTLPSEPPAKSFFLPNFSPYFLINSHSLNTIYMPMTPKFIISAWTFLLNATLQLPTWHLHLDIW